MNLSRQYRSIFLLLAIVTAGVAQGTRGTINGRVTDPAGAVVPGATVKLTNVARDQEVRTMSRRTKSGNFQFLELEPAIYTVTIIVGRVSPRSGSRRSKSSRTVMCSSTPRWLSPARRPS